MIYAVLAYMLWGLFPAFFPLLAPAAPTEIIAHRIVWTGVLMVGVVTASKSWSALRGLSARTWARLGLASVLIALNWLIYVIAVNSGHVADAALGYFINPLVNVVLGIAFLGERMRLTQSVSVLLAVVAVVVLTVFAGQPPIMALGLALSFGFYGLIKKKVELPATVSLTAETVLLIPFALGYLVFLEWTGEATFGHAGTGNALLLVATGVVTAVPLLLFGMGARLIPLSTVGMLQYMTPTMQMLWAVYVVDEVIEPVRWVGFTIIWVAVALYMWDVLRHHRQRGVEEKTAR
ncbi:EamA family transporter RarD [Corynebacterium felinum]|uniref:Chloramphenicol-sensitive protein RarD n=1 Tax=Corynebacterium felinum TaxID=131318 RepID=A0ABU2BBV0_9CORY|nr:EamA family transporter RarD [Corynebacterium felinum]MDF5820943.1 EamA family transporter RarD [Corynebacterium felinum]MDR7356112.1 chloramphenicol-sensitive protein RarD [Corynebacterium felinum]WJY95446.1 EamA-like transporter family protein [Corynebacterium felinum]